MATHKRILCIGGGALGAPVARHLSQNNKVTLIKRTPLEDASGLNVKCADISDLAQLEAAFPEIADIILICLSPSTYDETGYRKVFEKGVGNIISVLQKRHINPSRVFFISSTSVYHQNDSSWVDETSPTLPKAYSGQTLINAETMLKKSLPATVIRFSGIYGGNRTRLLEQVKSGLAMGTDDHFSNRIHEEDCIGVIIHLMEKALKGDSLESTYLASDSSPVTYDTLIQWLQSRMQCKPTTPDATSLGRRAGSKRCSNQRLLDSGYQFKYPTWQDGYQEMLARFV